MTNYFSGVGTAGDFTALPEALRNVYSPLIEHAALPVMRYEEFCVYKEELGLTPGQVVIFTTYDDVGGGGALSEHVTISTQKMSASTKSVTVTEYGNAIGFSEKLLRMSFDDNMKEAAILLGRNYAKVRDVTIRNAFVATGDVLFTTEGATLVGDVLEDDTLDIDTLRTAIKELHEVDAPMFMDDFYICFIHPHQAAALTRDPDWIAAQQYAGSRRLFNGELGRWENVVFIRTTMQGNGAAAATHPGYDVSLHLTGHDSQNLYRATVIADQAVGLADGLPVELRDNGVEDFGRTHKLAWYAIFGTGVLSSTFVKHIVSS